MQAAGHEVTNEELERAVAGDREAIAAVWRCWNPSLLRFLAARRIPDPEDLASTIWVELTRRLPAFVGDTDSFQRWLFTTAHRRLIDDSRRRARLPEPADIVDLEPGLARTPTFDDGWATSLVGRLPDDQATAVTLRFLLDMDVTSASQVMGMSKGNVRVLTHRGLKRLGRLLAAQRRAQQVEPLAVGRSAPHSFA